MISSRLQKSKPQDDGEEEKQKTRRREDLKTEEVRTRRIFYVS
jgi:hypothetical protein